MLISCPKCQSVYDISNKKVSVNGKKFKCVECGNIWTVYPSDENQNHAETFDTTPPMRAKTNSPAQTANNEKINTELADDLDLMFNRLSQNTKALFASGNSIETMTFGQRVRHYCLNFISSYAVIAFLLPLSIVLGALLLYLYRYDIAAKIPGMSSVYTHMNYDSLYKGKDLVFKDVSIRNIQENGNSLVEISGRLYNNGPHVVTLLPVKASIITAENTLVDEKTEILQERQLEPAFSALFRIVMSYPLVTDGKIRLTLENEKQPIKEKN